MNKMLIDWIDSEGLAPEKMRSLDWYNLDMAKVSDDVVIQIEECIGNFFKRHTRSELFEGCMERGINLCPVWTAPDLLDFVQLKERNYWVTADHPELGKTLKHTGPFFSSTEVDGFAMCPAPQIGQYNSEVYSELLNYSDTEIHTLKKEGVI
jgi:crotonobetainyl-CoA:carnitine CoA-transferase CaiB-like acyl-CoA transferase